MVRAVGPVVALAIVAVAIAFSQADRGPVLLEPGDRLDVSSRERVAGLTYGPALERADRAWIAAAVASARPHARALIAEVDGLVEVRAHRGGRGPGFVLDDGRERLTMSFDVAALAPLESADRQHVVLHEFGHILDHVLLSDDVIRSLDAGIPAGDACRGREKCSSLRERFADTFAKWAVDRVDASARVGYGVPAPPDLARWGAPLSRLAVSLGAE